MYSPPELNLQTPLGESMDPKLRSPELDAERIKLFLIEPLTLYVSFDHNRKIRN